jgi:autotransporter-associated beta strand protein
MNSKHRTGASALMAVMTMALTGWGQTLYWGGGHTDKADGAPLPTAGAEFSGVWNTTTRNWASSPAPGAYGAFAQGALADLGYATITTDTGKSAVITNETDLILSGLMLATGGNNYNQRITLKAVSPKTITFAGDEALVYAFATDGTRGVSVESSVSFAGAAPWLMTSPQGVFITKSSANVNSGTMNLRGHSSFILSDGGAMPAVPAWNLKATLFLNASAQSFSAPQLVVYCMAAGALNLFKDDAAFALNRGNFTLQLADHATAPSAETIGKLVLAPHGQLSLAGLYNGVEDPGSVGLNPTLTLSDPLCGIDRGADGRGTLIVSVPTSIASYHKGMKLGRPTADVVVSNGVATGTLLPWIPTTCSEFMQVNASTKVLEPVASTFAPTDPNTWVSGGNYRCGTNTAWVATSALTNDLAISSLGFWPKDSNCILSITNGKTLTLSSGALTRHNSSGVFVNTVITNGFLTSDSGQLTVTSGNYGGLTLYSTITGSGMELVKAGGGVTLGGADSNTYDGTTYVSGSLTASKSGSAVAVPGDLVIQPGGQFSASGSAPISATSAVTIAEDGVWNHGTSALVHGAPLTINGGCYYLQNAFPVFASSGNGLVFNGGRIAHYSSASGGISVRTDVHYPATATRQARWEQLYGGTGLFTLKLDGAQRTFDIADSAALADDVPEMVIDARIAPGSPAGGSLRKTGAGMLQLTDDNTYTGGTVVDGGTLRVSTLSAPAQSGLTASFVNTFGLVTFNQPVVTNLIVRQVVRSASNTGITSAKNVTGVLNPFQVVLTGTGATARPTDIVADAISRSGSLGTGPATVNDTGTLQLDPGIAVANAVTVNDGGMIAGSGASVGSLVVDGGTVDATLGAGALAVGGAASLTDASLVVTGVVGDEPETLLTAAGGLTGTFAALSLPPRCTVAYTATAVMLRKSNGTLILVR